MLLPVSPEDYGAIDGTANDNQYINMAVAEANATGRPLEFKRPVYGWTTQKAITRSGVRVNGGMSELRALGTADMYPMISVGVSPAPLQGRVVTAAVKPYSRVIFMNDTTGLDKGNLVRFSVPAPWFPLADKGRGAVIVDKDDEAIELSVDMPWDIPEGTPFNYIYTKAPVLDVEISHVSLAPGIGFTGAVLYGFGLVFAKDCLLRENTGTDLKHGFGLSSGAVNCTLIKSLFNGGNSADAVLTLTGTEGIIIRDFIGKSCKGFGLHFGASCKVVAEDIVLRNDGATVFARAIKNRDVSSCIMRRLDTKRWNGMVYHMEGGCCDNLLVDSKIIDTQTVSGAASWGIGINHNENNNNWFINVDVHGTSTTNGGLDIAISAPVDGFSPKNNHLVNLPSGITTYYGTPQNVY